MQPEDTLLETLHANLHNFHVLLTRGVPVAPISKDDTPGSEKGTTSPRKGTISPRRSHLLTIETDGSALILQDYRKRALWKVLFDEISINDRDDDDTILDIKDRSGSVKTLQLQSANTMRAQA